MHKLVVSLTLTLITGNLIRVKAEQDKTLLKPRAENHEKPDKIMVEAMTLDKLVQKVLTEGRITRKSVRKGIAKDLGFTEDKPVRLLQVKDADSLDGQIHEFLVPWDMVEEKEKPLALIFYKKKRDVENLFSEAQYFKLNMDGKLELAYSQTGKYNDDMKPIPGSAKVTFPDIDSPSVKEGLEREMDFWLKGMYRKPTAGETAEPEESAKPASPSKTDQATQ